MMSTFGASGEGKRIKLRKGSSMKYTNLMEAILSKENLKGAYAQVVSNKGSAGIDGMRVEDLRSYLTDKRECTGNSIERRSVPSSSSVRSSDTQIKRRYWPIRDTDGCGSEGTPSDPPSAK